MEYPLTSFALEQLGNVLKLPGLIKHPHRGRYRIGTVAKRLGITKASPGTAVGGLDRTAVKPSQGVVSGILDRPFTAAAFYKRNGGAAFLDPVIGTGDFGIPPGAAGLFDPVADTLIVGCQDHSGYNQGKDQKNHYQTGLHDDQFLLVLFPTPFMIKNRMIGISSNSSGQVRLTSTATGDFAFAL